MYKIKLWDEDKWNIHSSSYNSSKYGSINSEDKKDDKKYNEQKYGAREKSTSSDYMKKDEQQEKDDKDKNPSQFDELVEEERKEQKQETDEEITFKAAKQIFGESVHETKKSEKKKDIDTIEDAIKKAIEEEKKIVIMDN